jgi:hypothetical protein
MLSFVFSLAMLIGQTPQAPQPNIQQQIIVNQQAPPACPTCSPSRAPGFFGVPAAVPTLPPTITIQPYARVQALRWGLLKRRLVPTSVLVPMTPKVYVPWQPAQQAPPSASQ